MLGVFNPGRAVHGPHQKVKSFQQIRKSIVTHAIVKKVVTCSRYMAIQSKKDKKSIKKISIHEKDQA
jgi:hypothetical protein